MFINSGGEISKTAGTGQLRQKTGSALIWIFGLFQRSRACVAPVWHEIAEWMYYFTKFVGKTFSQTRENKYPINELVVDSASTPFQSNCWLILNHLVTEELAETFTIPLITSNGSFKYWLGGSSKYASSKSSSDKWNSLIKTLFSELPYKTTNSVTSSLYLLPDKKISSIPAVVDSSDKFDP